MDFFFLKKKKINKVLQLNPIRPKPRAGTCGPFLPNARVFTSVGIPTVSISLQAKNGKCKGGGGGGGGGAAGLEKKNWFSMYNGVEAELKEVRSRKGIFLYVLYVCTVCFQ